MDRDDRWHTLRPVEATPAEYSNPIAATPHDKRNLAEL
jgi:hypothetical protein